ncbi:hypothetical protein L3Q82_015180 [Scortum barcoo]|uniref:Uncharacterized protein n=1 Tax=Scortum barcoo TaxID=214431 RepID=A0ACB8VTR4_9TELE|nr:hypothetical protein L3Q82_015180 [Scortum barcoo]
MTGTMGMFKYSPFDFVLTCMGLLLQLLDIVLDVYAAVTFYQEKAYVSLSVLVLCLVCSSVLLCLSARPLLVQAFSWLWYTYEDFRRETRVEQCLSPRLLWVLHVLQLGIYFRLYKPRILQELWHAGVVEISVPILSSQTRDPPAQGVAAFLNHDLSMLRFIETFSESAPQFVLMLTIILQEGHFDLVIVAKTIASASAIAFSVTMYHRSMRSFLSEKKKQQIDSSLGYFFWNLLLISSRLTALALFASVFPCFIFTHFLCSWAVLCFVAWRCKTDFMNSACGERLYRVTVGLIWYFSWFNVVKGRTLYRILLYHTYMLIDISVLCSVWYWKVSSEPTNLKISPLYAFIIAVVAAYVLGLVFKLIYYQCCHPNVAKENLQGDVGEKPLGDVTDFAPSSPGEECVGNTLMLRAFIATECTDTDFGFQSGPSQPAPETKRYNKRMRKLAENFYS